MQLSLLIDETELYSPIIWIVGAIVADSSGFAIDSSRRSKKQRCEWMMLSGGQDPGTI